MEKQASILIVDDDVDFNSLLKDVFQQSGYAVEAVHDPDEGFELFCDNDYDIVVTDQKMPGLTGDQLVRKMREVHTDIPIIMVSGYLDNETIRSLIREGVSGVFLKPLDVFKLMKRANALVNERRKNVVRNDDASSSIDEFAEFDHRLGFPFNSFPCKDEKSQVFARKLHGIRDFKTNLILVGEKGADIDAIIDDMIEMENEEHDSFESIGAGEFSESVLFSGIHEAETRKCTRVTFVIPHPEMLDEPNKALLYAAQRHEAPFDNLELLVRYLFFLTTDIDALYDAGEITDDLYMFMGTSELRIPALRETRDDILYLAQRFLNAEATKNSAYKIPKLDNRARIYLRERDWPGNVLELKSYCRTMFQLGKEIITREDIMSIEQKMNFGGSTFGEFRLLDDLKTHRDDFSLAVLELCGRDPHRAAGLLGVDTELLMQIHNRQKAMRKE